MTKDQMFHIGVNVFVVKKKRLLLGKRKNVYGAGDWGLPGGHLEFKEGMKAGAKRELYEETGLRARDLSFVNLANDSKQQRDRHYMHIGFLAKGVKGKPVLKEPDRCDGWAWFALNKLPKNIFSGHAEQIKAFKQKSFFVDD